MPPGWWALKVVEPGCRCVGTLSVAIAAPASLVSSTTPACHPRRVDAALLVALDVQVGQLLLLGDASSQITRVRPTSPDKGAASMNFAPLRDSPVPSGRHRWCNPPAASVGAGAVAATR